MKIELLNGTVYDIADYNLKRLFHFIPSITVGHESQPIDGGVGSRITDTRFESRTITVRFLYEVYDIQDYYLLRDEINALFTRREPYYISFKNESYKRYKVRLDGNFMVEPNARMNEFEVTFICEDLYGESIATTQALKEWDIDKFGWNNAITWDDPIKYVFNENNFTLFNGGTATVDPRQSRLTIALTGNFTSFVKIENLTTGDIYQYNGVIDSTKTLFLIGVNTSINNINSFENTNKKLLTIAPGNNRFQITGGTVSDIRFDFRYLYL